MKKKKEKQKDRTMGSLLFKHFNYYISQCCLVFSNSIPPAPLVCQGEINILKSRTYKAPNLLVETGIEATKLFLYPMKI